MPKPFPNEFRNDVIAVSRQGDRSRAEVARSFGISESCLGRWLAVADREDGIATDDGSDAASTGSATDLKAENREQRKRAKQLEQENEILRRATAYFARDVLTLLGSSVVAGLITNLLGSCGQLRALDVTGTYGSHFAHSSR